MIFFNNNGELTDQAKQKILKSAKKRLRLSVKQNRKIEITVNWQKEPKNNYIKEWTKRGSPWQLLLDKKNITFSMSLELIAFFEVGYGHDCLYNMKDDTFWFASNGIFLDNVVILGSCYGHDTRPAIYLRDTSTLSL